MGNRKGAQPTINGFEFQNGATIYFLLKHFSEVESISCEQPEDISLKINDGSVIFAQAKSSLEGNPLYENTHWPEFKSGINELDKDVIDQEKKGKINKIIFVFNYHHPLCFKKDAFGGSFSEKKFSSLSTKDKTKIKKHISKPWYDEYLYLSFIKWEGGSPSANIEDFMKEKISKWIGRTSLSYKSLYNNWDRFVRDNIRNKTPMPSSIFRGSILDVVCNKIDVDMIKDISSKINLSLTNNNEIEEIVNETTNIFDKNIISYKSYIKIVADFQESISNGNATEIMDFIKFYSATIDELNILKNNTNSLFFEKIYKIFLYIVLNKEHLIDQLDKNINIDVDINEDKYDY